MSINRWRFIPFTTVIVLALSVAAAAAMVGGDTPIKPGEGKRPPATTLSEEENAQLIDQKKVESRQTDAFLSQFDTSQGTRTPQSLPAVYMLAEVAGPTTLAHSAGNAEAIVVARTQRVRYVPSDVDGFTDTIATFHVSEALKGPLAKGDSFDTRIIGGPIRRNAGDGGPSEVMLTLERWGVDRPGQEVILLLVQDGGQWMPVDMGGKFVVEHGQISQDDNTRDLGIAGAAADGVLAKLRVLNRRTLIR